MYLEDNDIDNLYQDFRNSEATPPSNSKDFVMDSIGKKKSVWRFAWLLLALVGFGGLVFLFIPGNSGSSIKSGITTNDSLVKDKSEEETVSIQMIDPNANAQLSGNDFQVEEKNDAIFQDEDLPYDKKINDDFHANNLKDQNKNNVRKDYAPDANIDKTYAAKKKSNPSLVKNKKNQGINDKLSNNMKKSEFFANANNLKDDAITKNDANIDNYPLKKANTKAVLANNLIIEDDLALEKLDFKRFESFPYNVEEDEYIGLISLKPNRIKKLFFGVELNSGYTFSDALTQKNSIAYNEVGMMQYLHGFELGLNGIMNYKNMLFKLGIGYQNQKSSTNYTNYTYEIKSTVAYEVLLDTNNNPYNSLLYTFVDTSLVNTSYQLKLSTSYFILPFQVGYQFRLMNRWSVDLLAGMHFGFLMDVQSSYSSIDILDYYETIDHGSFNRFIMDATLNLGLNYQFTQHIGLGFSLPLRMGLNSRIQDSKALNYSIGGLVNLRYQF